MSKVGITFGAFDVLHAGHCLMLKEAKKHCDKLIVGLQTDPTIDRPEKNKPIQSLEERYIQLASNKYVDVVAIYETEDDLIKLLTYLKPDVRIIGADWKGKAFTGKWLDVPVVYNTRSHPYSSSELRERIKNAD